MQRSIPHQHSGKYGKWTSEISRSTVVSSSGSGSGGSEIWLRRDSNSVLVDSGSLLVDWVAGEAPGSAVETWVENSNGSRVLESGLCKVTVHSRVSQ